MNSKFSEFSDLDLIGWWAQYGQPAQAGFYPAAPRRGARREMERRGIEETKTCEWAKRPLTKFWGIGGAIR